MKKFKELKDKQKVLAVFGILGLVLILTGVTYAFFSYTKEGSTENTLKSGSITFWYDEINQSGNSISIEDALPMSDTAGKAQTAAFNFKIQSTTSSTTTIPYEITLRQKQGTDDIGSIVKVYLAKTSAVDASIASEEEVELSLFSELSNVTKNGYSEKLLHTDIVPASDSPYTQFYRLKMWIDGSADYSADQNGQYPYNNKTFTVTVNVYANGHVLDGNSGTASINSVSVGGTELTVDSTENGIDLYKATLLEGTTSTTISIDTGDYDQVTVTKTESDYTTPVAVNDNIQRLSNTVNKRVSLTDGVNYFKVVARSEDNTDSKESHIRIQVGGPRLRDLILEDNTTIYTNPTLTTSSSNSSDASGLYSMNVSNGFSNGANGTTYYFRGNPTNNYVKFANYSWRVIRINEDGTIRLMLIDRFTGTIRYTHNSKSLDAMYYSNSDVLKPAVDTWYDNNIGSNTNYASRVASGNYFCESAKVAWDNSWAPSGMAAYSTYTPNLECPKDTNNKQYVSGSIGLLNYDEVILAGGYPGQNNTNYHLRRRNNDSIWTMSPAGYPGGSSDARDWYIDGATGQPLNGVNYATLDAYPIINLKANVTATKQTISGIEYYVVD